MNPSERRTTPRTSASAADPMDDRRCRATARSGERCKRYAIPGGRVCSMHGGASPRVRAAAEQRRAEREALALIGMIWDPDAAPVTNPIEALQRLAGQLQHATSVVGGLLDAGSLEGATAVAFTRLLKEFRLTLEGMERLDLQGKHVELEQERASLVTTAFIEALRAVSLLPADKDLMLRTFLRGLGREPEADARLQVVVRGELA